MKISDLLVLVKACDNYRLPYDFYISRYPVAITDKHQVRIGTPADSNLYRTTWKSAAVFCNHLSRKNNLKLAYTEDPDDQVESRISIDTLTQQSFRLPTPQEWDYAAHGWSGSRTGDYFPIQKEHFRIPFLDYPTTEEQQWLFEHGYSTFAQSIANPIGIYGLGSSCLVTGSRMPVRR